MKKKHLKDAIKEATEKNSNIRNISETIVNSKLVDLIERRNKYNNATN